MQRFFFFCFFLSLSGSAAAQIPAETILETAVRNYNNLREMTGNLKPETITETDLRTIAESVEMNNTMLDTLVASAPEPLALAAHYFHLNFAYTQASFLKMAGDSTATAHYLTLEPQMGQYSNGQFPIEYKLEGKKYLVRWENFAPVQAGFYAGLCELLYNAGDYENALTYGRIARENAYIPSFQEAQVSVRLVSIKLQRGEFDTEALDVAIAGIDAFNLLDADEQQFLESTPDQLADAVENILTTDTTLSNNGEKWAKAATYLKRAQNTERYLRFGGLALSAGYNDRDFAEDLADNAIEAGDETTARMAADRLFDLLQDNDCKGMLRLASLYRQLHDTKRANALVARAGKCEQLTHKEQPNENPEGGLYLGAYLIPLIQADWGFVAAVHAKKFMVEGSYLNLAHKRDKLRDISDEGERVYWDGYYAHLALSAVSGGKAGRRPYSGVLFGYNLREYEPIDANVYDLGGQSMGIHTYYPKETRFILMWNSGMHTNTRFFGADLFLGIGGSYDIFERGGLEGSGFLYGHPLLQNRKETRVSFMARAGVTIGLDINARTFK